MKSEPPVVAGHVTTPDGAPAPGARVLLDREDAPHRFDGDGPGPWRTATDAKGRYEFPRTAGLLEGVGASRLRVWAHRESQAAFHALLHVQPGAIRADLVLGPAVRPVVRIEDAEGEPVAAAAVTFYLPGDRDPAGGLVLAHTDDDGRASFPPVPAASLPAVRLEIVHFRLPRTEVEVVGERILREPPLTVRIRGGRAVRGRLLLPDGDPAAGLTVALTGLEPRHAETGPDGAFRLFGLAPAEGVLHVLDGRSPAPWPVPVPAGEPDDETDLGEIALPRPGGLRIEAEDPDLLGAEVFLRRDGTDESFGIGVLGPAGREVPVLFPGLYVIELYPPVGGALEVRTVEIPEGADVALRLPDLGA